MKRFFEKRKIALRMVSAEEHDRRNAVIGVGHFVGLILAEVLTDEEKEVLGGVRSGSWLVGLMKHLQANSYTTWRETQLDNPFTGEQRKRLIEAFQKYDGVLGAGTFPFDKNAERGTGVRAGDPGIR